MSDQDGCSASTRVSTDGSTFGSHPFPPSQAVLLVTQASWLVSSCASNCRVPSAVTMSTLRSMLRGVHWPVMGGQTATPSPAGALRVTLSLIQLHGLHLARRCNCDIHCRGHSTAKAKGQKGCPKRWAPTPTAVASS